MSENLTKLAQKIDFSKTDPEDSNKEITELVDKSDDDKDQKTSTLWPWDSVRNKLRYVHFLFLMVEIKVKKLSSKDVNSQC